MVLLASVCGQQADCAFSLWGRLGVGGEQQQGGARQEGGRGIRDEGEQGKEGGWAGKG